ncbi:MAG: geranylgeranylglycerol-phosphate geranylgeranyltransferase [Prevotellaceae bacterium]|jgi:4-hydroxybenzoate polyprenyltransferase|nr:geranylgeranylglycerol-phosphate geranylgeranyltransferase [Prevotellaceae bacterium]
MLNLIRYKNLIFIVLIQWLIYFSVLMPILQKYAFLSAPLPSGIFWLLTLATVLIAAGGYVINDYFDLKIDRINRPESVIIGEKISKKAAMSLYITLTSAGVLLGVVVAILLKSSTLGFIFAITAGMLWFYSSSYKRQFLVGNLIVAFSSALAVLVVLAAERASFSSIYSDELIRQMPPSLLETYRIMIKELYFWVCGFALFAFLLTLVREVVKDLEDIVGDREMECRTLPIVWGEKNAKIVVTCLLSAILTGLFFVVHKFNLPNDNISFRYFIFGILLPSTISIVFLWNKKFSYKISGDLIKFTMLTGILYTLIFNYLIAKAYGFALFGMFQIL